MTCNKMGLLFSWQGQASLGGYIGDDFEAFFSSVVSGAAGTYLTTLRADAGISTDLTIHAGQAVVVSRVEGLAAAPGWGDGGISVEERGSLSLSRVAVTGSLTVHGGGSATVSGGSLAGNIGVVPGTTYSPPASAALALSSAATWGDSSSLARAVFP